MSIWYAYNNIAKNGSIAPYTGECPPYYDLKGVPWYDRLSENLTGIQAQVISLLEQKNTSLQQYYNTALVEEGKWESQAFLVWNMLRPAAEKEGNELLRYFDHIPGLVSLSVSVLKPGTHIKPHSGDTDAIYRIHVPVLIPAGLPRCGIKVNGITRHWPDNESVAFCDAHMHEAWNHSDKTRIILIADVVRTEHLSHSRTICTRVSSWLLVQKVFQIKLLQVLPGIIKSMIAIMVFIVATPLFTVFQRRGQSVS